jgi:hypothetical protein
MAAAIPDRGKFDERIIANALVELFKLGTDRASMRL